MCGPRRSSPLLVVPAGDFYRPGCGGNGKAAAVVNSFVAVSQYFFLSRYRLRPPLLNPVPRNRNRVIEEMLLKNL